jgi:hypothetical protein
MSQEIITADGEVIDGFGTSSSVAVQLQKAEIDQLITTARAYPRSMKRVQSAIMNMATLDEESAEECMYALPRGGKPIKGPSIRFAEILKQSFGNCRAGARVVDVDRVEMFVEAEGVFHDLETNASTTARVRRRISDKNGKLFKDDMIIVTGNAACSIAMRNAILAGVPKPLWRKAYDSVQATITGDVTTLSENREKALKALAAFGVKPEQIFASLGKEGLEDITVDDIGLLRGMYAALKNGEATVEEMFFGTVKSASQHEKIENPLSDEPVKPEPTRPADPVEFETTDAGTTPNTNPDEDASSVGDDESGSAPAPSTEPDQTVSPDPAPTAEPAERPDASPSAAGSAPSKFKFGADERLHLIDFARKALDDASGDQDDAAKLYAIDRMRLNYTDAVESADARQAIEAMDKALTAVAKRQRTREQAAGYIATEILGCSASELEGRRHG